MSISLNSIVHKNNLYSNSTTLPRWPNITRSCCAESTYRNQHAVEVAVLFLVSVGIHGSQQLLEPLNPRDSQDGDAAVTAEGLQQREVDLQRHIIFIIGCQDAEDHAVRISEEERENE